MNVNIAAVQMDPDTGNIAGNTEIIIKNLRTMSRNNVKLAVFPEMCMYGYDSFECLGQDNIRDAISKVHGILGRYCRELKINAVVGGPYYTETGIENALFYIDETGAAVHIYSKQKLTHDEKDYFIPGNAGKIHITPAGRTGFLICWDTAFPEIARSYVMNGADLLIICAAWEKPYDRQWELAVCARCLDCAVPAVAANRCGTDGEKIFCGRSMIVDCMGNHIAAADADGEKIIMTDIESVYRSRDMRKEFGIQLEE